MNAEVVCYKGKWDDIKTVGISQGREQEKVLAKRTYPQIENFMDITQKGILYTLEGGQVDAVIQDITKAAKVSEYSCRSISADDYISYVLVVKKEFVETDAFTDFIKSYNRAVDKLNNKAYLANILEVQESWIKEKEIKFLTLDER